MIILYLFLSEVILRLLLSKIFFHLMELFTNYIVLCTFSRPRVYYYHWIFAGLFILLLIHVHPYVYLEHFLAHT